MRPAPSSIRALVLGLAAVVLLAPATGCDDDNNPLGNTDVCAAFIPSAAPAAGTVVAREGADSTCDIVEIEVVATDIDGVFSANWVLEYDDQALFYLGADTDGSHFASDGNSLISNFSSSGTAVTASVSRNASQSTMTVDFTGTQLIATLTFARLTVDGSSSVTFSNEGLRDNDQPPAVVATPPWAGGTVRVN